MITVACVFWVGSWNRPRNYTALWVQRLKKMVEKNLSLPHEFVCLTNVGVDGVHCIPLELGYPGWWSKLELFGHDLGRTLYLDLDVVVTGSLDPIVEFPEKIAFAPPHHVIVGQPKPAPRPGHRPVYQTSCMVWSPPAGYEILSRFHGSVIRTLNGDQDWIAEVNPDYPIMPKEWFGKMRHCPKGPKPEMKVVFGGKTKNDDPNFKWVKRIWTDGDLLGAKSGVAHAGH